MFEAEIMVGGIEIIAALAAEWLALCREGSCNEPFARPEWFAAFAGSFGMRVEVLTVRRGGKLRAVLPLVCDRTAIHGMPVRNLHAAYNLNTPRFDLIHGSDEGERAQVAESIWKTLKSRPAWDVMEARLVPSDSWMNDVISLARQDRFLAGLWPMDGAPCIAIDHGGDKERFLKNYFKGPRKHLGQELNRRLRRLNETGVVEFVTADSVADDTVRRYLDLERKGWKGRAGTAAVQDADATRLHEQFAAAAAETKALRVYELRLDGATIAMSLNLCYGTKLYHWKTSYDEDFRRYSPGSLLFKQLLNDCVDSDVTEIDFLSPATPYKLDWATGVRDHAAYYIFQPSVAGCLCWLWKFSVIGRLRRFKGNHPRMARMLSL